MAPVNVDGEEALGVVIGAEQRELLMPVHRILRVVDIHLDLSSRRKRKEDSDEKTLQGGRQARHFVAQRCVLRTALGGPGIEIAADLRCPVDGLLERPIRTPGVAVVCLLSSRTLTRPQLCKNAARSGANYTPASTRGHLDCSTNYRALSNAGSISSFTPSKKCCVLTATYLDAWWALLTKRRWTMPERPCSQQTNEEIAHMWDRLAPERHRQIVSGEDLSFLYVTKPTALSLLNECEQDIVLDVGCGTGVLTQTMADTAGQIIAVEPSSVSIDIAKRFCRPKTNIRFLKAPIEEVADILADVPITCAAAIMTLQDVGSLQDVAVALNGILSPRSKLVAILPHPCFWPQYWGYHNCSWFDYSKEIPIEGAYRISGRSTEIATVHTHRPLQQYLNMFSAHNFSTGKNG